MLLFSKEYLEKNGKIKIVIKTKFPCFNARLSVRENIFEDSFNLDEPYDRKTHIFYLDPKLLKIGIQLVFTFKLKPYLKTDYSHYFPYNPQFADPQKLLYMYDSQIEPFKTDSEIIADGVVYSHYSCNDKNNAPVEMFTLEIDTKKASLYVGTPNDGYENKNVKAKIPQMIDDAVNNGVNVVAAMNADFFDMFGDCHPSGLCIKNSKLVANENSQRPFIAIKKDGSPVITSLTEEPDIIPDLAQAASGLQMVVKDGRLFEWAELEPFSYTRHPRTAVGLKKDGTVILLEVDGRIPEYSNGATLVDLASIMIGLGVDRAINLDGGGSSIVITRLGDRFDVRNRPADLIRPKAKLIRKEFNALLVVQ